MTLNTDPILVVKQSGPKHNGIHYVSSEVAKQLENYLEKHPITGSSMTEEITVPEILPNMDLEQQPTPAFSFAGILEQSKLQLQRIRDFLIDAAYQKVRAGLFLGLIIFVVIKIAGAVVVAIDNLFFFSEFFQLIGVSYSAWFVYRYLLRPESRQAVKDKLDEVISDIL